MSTGWSLDPQCWEIFSGVVPGLTFISFQLRIENEVVIPEASGIYIICSRPSTVSNNFSGKLWTTLYNAQYVGKSTNLRKRFKEHVIGYKDVAKVKSLYRHVDFWYAQVAQDRLEVTEGYIWDVLRPAANKIKPGRAKFGAGVPAN